MNGKPAKPTVTDTAPPSTKGSGVAASIKIPLLSASISVPGPGAALKIGPAALTLPTGPLYYVGLGALAAVGALELPGFIALAAGGAILRKVSQRSPAAPASRQPA